MSESSIPRHVAVIMDGNGRWAQKRHMPRPAGHRAGVKSVRRIVENAHKANVECLTLFAFSSENWQRPEDEVSLLMELFMRTLRREVAELHGNNVKIEFIGDHQKLGEGLREQMQQSKKLTQNNTGLQLNIAVGYGGQDDLVQATQSVARRVQRGEIQPEDIDRELLSQALCLADQPSPDLFIRTGGESRISNFLLWQLAYAELYFCEALWPDFGDKEFQAALDWFAGRQRRFGLVPEQAV